MISTRRFFAIPSGVSFGATGLVAPNAWAERISGLTLECGSLGFVKEHQLNGHPAIL